MWRQLSSTPGRQAGRQLRGAVSVLRPAARVGEPSLMAPETEDRAEVSTWRMWLVGFFSTPSRLVRRKAGKRRDRRLRGKGMGFRDWMLQVPAHAVEFAQRGKIGMCSGDGEDEARQENRNMLIIKAIMKENH